MTQAELEKRQDRARTETLVIKKTQEGFRVYSPGNPVRNYLVIPHPNHPTCSCPDFENHAHDPDWRCKHILAIDSHLHPALGETTEVDPVEREERLAIQDESRRSQQEQRNGRSPSQMLLKRSVSPDGRIDSLSVEFSCPTSEVPAQEVLRHARQVIAIQSEIVDDFLTNANDDSGVPPNCQRGKSGSVQGRMLRIGGMDTRWGRRLFINVQVNGDVLKYFGSKKALSEALEAAGYADRTELVEEGAVLDLPCRVTTKASDDGRYINIAELLPPAASQAQRKGAR